jgi:hypothetical protein
MLIKDILAELAKPGENTRTVAKRMEGIGEKRLVSLLKQAGYEFSNNAPRGWHYTNEGEEPLDKDIFNVKSGSPSSRRKVEINSHKNEVDVKPNSPGLEKKVNSPSLKDEMNVQSHSPKERRIGEVLVKPTSQKVNEPNKEKGFDSETDVNEDYSKLMYEELKTIRGLLQAQEPKGKVVVSDSLLDRISGLNRAASKTRKTIVIDDNIAKQLDQFAKKKRVNKSDLIEVALLDLFERY